MAWTMTREGRAGRWRSVGIFAVAAVSFSSFLTAAAEALCARIDGVARRVKIGLELFVSEGPPVVAAVRKRGLGVFLDLKLHDIPETVRRAADRKSTRLNSSH